MTRTSPARSIPADYDNGHEPRWSVAHWVVSRIMGLAALELLTFVAAFAEPVVLSLLTTLIIMAVAAATAPGLSQERCFRRSLLVGLGGREPVAEGDGEGVDDELPPLCPSGASGPGRVPVDQRVADRIAAETGASPLALIEVGAELTAEELAGHAALPCPVPLTRQLADRLARQVDGLDPKTRAFLLLAAASLGADRAVLWRAAVKGGIDAGKAAAEAEAAGLIEDSAGAVRFRYPLIRSAVYHGAAAADRRRAHLLLSAATDPGQDPDRRAWHRGAAAIEADEDVAAELEAAAARAQARGGKLSVSSRAQLARRLPASRHPLLFRAASTAWLLHHRQQRTGTVIGCEDAI